MKIAYSNYFKRYIKLVDFKSDDDWTFSFCNKKGKVCFWERRIIKARSKYSSFNWIEKK